MAKYLRIDPEDFEEAEEALEHLEKILNKISDNANELSLAIAEIEELLKNAERNIEEM